jgi:hypothetical protein
VGDDRPDSVDDEHARPPGVSDAVVEAVGMVSEALEGVHRARGHLYAMHQLIGGADLKLGEAAELLRQEGQPELADEIEHKLVGRNVIAGRWTFQLVEEFDDGYYRLFEGIDRTVRDRLVGGRRHVYEAEMKQRRRSHGTPGHEATPAE